MEKIRKREKENLASILKEERENTEKMTRRKKIVRKMKDRIVTSHVFMDNGIEYDESKSLFRPRIVVYSCVTGGYDKVSEPEFVFDNIDYVLFTDTSMDLKKWNVKPIPEFCDRGSSILTNRYIKMHPCEIFRNSNYDFAIYVDGNLKIVGDLTPLTSDLGSVGIAMHRHALRDDIRKEVIACIAQKKGNAKKLVKQVYSYSSQGFPKNFGMLECNMIVTDLKSKIAEKILDEWWDEFMKSGSMRDQLSLPYVVWKMGYAINDFGNLGYNIYRNPKIRKNNHKV